MKKIILTCFLSLSFIYSPFVSDTYAETATLSAQGTSFIPDNTKCKTLTTNHVNELDYNGKKPGITRSCIGWTPNFPSTRVEGGQGTYFYFAYKIFPTPMPAYKVTTNDKLGLSQTFELKEPDTTLGACNLKINDTLCKLYEPFLYYPSKWESRFGTDSALSDLKGPYTVGPHEFYHYRYRGRLVPQRITFHYNIIDMTNQELRSPLAFGDIVYDVPDNCYHTHVIDIKESCRTIQFYIPAEGLQNPRILPTNANIGTIPTERIRFYNPGEHTFRVEVDEQQMYLYQTDDGAEWQGKDGVYRKITETDEPNQKYIELHKYAEGVFSVENNRYDPVTNIGVGNWCYMLNCSIEKPDVGMLPTVYYDQDGYEGILSEITTPTKFVLTEGVPSDFKYIDRYDPEINTIGPYEKLFALGQNCYEDAFKGGQLTEHCDADGPGYDYFQRGLFKQADGSFKRSKWRQHSRNNGMFLGWTGLKTTDDEFYGYEWKRYQIVGGIVTKKDSAGSNVVYGQYSIGPVNTHTLKTLPSGEIVWVIQDNYQNHCYSEEDAFSKYGTWNQSNAQFTQQDAPAFVCSHNHDTDFHFWKFKWSPVKKFGGNLRNGLIY